MDVIAWLRQLGLGSALGREFSFALLRRVARRDPETLAQALGQLAAAGLIVVRGAPPDAHCFFRHALLPSRAASPGSAAPTASPRSGLPSTP